MSSTFGDKIKISIFGESHGGGIGVVIDGLPAGEKIDLDAVLVQMARRAPGKDKTATPRRESDLPKILSGILGDALTGAPLCAVIENTNTRSSDYGNLLSKPRPAHSDYTAFVKYKGANDIRGGGHFSGRITAPIVFSGAICRQLLEKRGVKIAAHIASIGSVSDVRFCPAEIDDALMNRLSLSSFALIDECGIEFGAGFELSKMRGSNANDPFRMKDGRVVTETNNCGGILGGISNGMPIIFRAAIKPTPSISQKQRTVDLQTGENAELEIRGRHDPCIVPRAVPVIEAAAAIALINLF